MAKRDPTLVERLRKLDDGRDEYRAEVIGRAADHIEALEARVAELEGDKERWRALENMPGVALINDDAGNWTVCGDGYQNISDENHKSPSQGDPIDIQTTFFVEAANWHPSINAAIDAAREPSDG